MADNLSILDSTGTAKTVRTTDTASVHVPHHIVDSVTGTVTVAGTGTFVTQSVVTNAGTFAVQATQSGTWNITNISGTVSLPTGASTESTLSTLNGKVTACNTGAVVLAAGTASIGKLAANSGVDIGDVDVTSAVVSSGTLTTCSTVTTVTTLTGSGIAHDAVDSGNPHKIGARATASVLGGTPVAAADRTDILAGTDGVPFVRPHTSLEDIISEVKTNTDGSSTAMTGAFAATASQRIYLTSLIICNSSATNITVDIRDGSAGSVLATFPVPAGGGCIHAFPVPLRFSANTALAFDGSAAATTLTVSCVGFKAKI
jgi:hypothetical protein